MMRALAIVLGAIIGIPVLWLASGFVYESWNSYAHRFRLTIEVETPDGVKSASSVIRVAVTEKANWIPQTSGVYNRVTGEAVFVALGNERHVIALLAFGPNGNEDRIADLAPRAFNRYRASWYREAPSWTGRAELSGNLIPTLVTFSDLNDPRTARVVRPDEFEQVFGPGVRFRRAWIEMTDEPVTRGINRTLTWLDHLDRYRTDPRNPFTNQVRFGRPHLSRG